MATCTRLEEYVEVARRQVADIQSALRILERELVDYCRPLGVEKQRRCGLGSLLCGLSNHLVDHTSLVDSVRGFLRKDMDHDLNIYLRAIFAAVRDHTSDFRSATSKVVDTRSATLHQPFRLSLRILMVVWAL